MRSILLAFSILVATPAIAAADGLGLSCDENHDGTSDCNQDNDGDGINECTCDARKHSAGRVTGSLLILGVMVAGLARRRRK